MSIGEVNTWRAVQKAAEQTNALLAELIYQQQRTNQLLEAQLGPANVPPWPPRPR